MSLYTVQVHRDGQWVTIAVADEPYCMGYADCYRAAHAPHPAIRVLGGAYPTVVAEWPARDDVSFGQVAGFPTADQVEAAAHRALEKAKRIREAEARRSRP